MNLNFTTTNLLPVKKKNQAIFKTIRKEVGAWLLLLPFLILLYFMVWRPMIGGTLWSFYDMKGYEPTEFIGFKNYITVFQDTQFLQTLGNTLQYVMYSLLIGFIPPVILAILLNEVIHGNNYFKLSMYFPCMIPGVAVSMLWYYIYFPNSGGLLNTLLSLLKVEPSVWLQNSKITIPLIIISCTWRGLGGTMLMYLAALQGINQDLYEAALIDGAGFFSRVRNITLPQISGILLLYLVRQIISVFQIMEQPLAMTGGGPNGASLSLSLQGYRYAFEYFLIGNSLALGVITFLMLIVLTVFYFFLKKRVEDNL